MQATSASCDLLRNAWVQHEGLLALRRITSSKPKERDQCRDHADHCRRIAERFSIIATNADADCSGGGLISGDIAQIIHPVG